MDNAFALAVDKLTAKIMSETNKTHDEAERLAIRMLQDQF